MDIEHVKSIADKLYQYIPNIFLDGLELLEGVWHFAATNAKVLSLPWETVVLAEGARGPIIA